ncbi:MAG: glycogen debranching protein GlgX, partial [Calditrichia bacterium]
NNTKPARVIRLDPDKNRTFPSWHAFVEGLGEGQLYGFRVYGPFDPKNGKRFNGDKILLDPYARSVIVGENYDREAAIKPGDNCNHAMKSVVVDPRSYDWQDDLPLQREYAVSVIYECHVAGFTKHLNSGVAKPKRGTYAGLIEKIPYLQELGITAVELMPVQLFDEQDVLPPQKNYWGYNPVAFFAPHCGYSSDKSALGPLNEFRHMVKALHKAGIEVILDVVFNHTAEGDHRGPTLSFRGLENEAYYLLEEDKSKYSDYTGTGNSVNANFSVVRRLILDCLRYWVREMHVDGFRFDLASVLSRGESGEPMKNPPLLWAIESSPELAGTKIIAEAWDAAGLYQVGSFIGDRWAEWNGQFRDDIRRFVRGDEGVVKKAASRIIGSPDIYQNPEREPNRSINFITCHDGFTLNDLVSYNRKHNEDNGERNKDGADENYSWNCGVEGPAEDPTIENLRLKQIKNFLTILFVSQGTPMLLMGDEVRRTQKGNNNAYCQDNEISWFDWNLVEKNKGLFRFTSGLINFIQTKDIFSEEKFLKTKPDNNHPYVSWSGVELKKPDWQGDSHSLACTLINPKRKEKLHIIFNAFWEPLEFNLPKTDRDKNWCRIIDTALSSPDDFCEPEKAPVIKTGSYQCKSRSVVLLYMM